MPGSTSTDTYPLLYALHLKMHYQVQNCNKAVFGTWDHRSFVDLSIFAAQRVVGIWYTHFLLFFTKQLSENKQSSSPD